MDSSNTEPGPLKALFRSQTWLGGFSNGDLFAWMLATLLWISTSGGVFDDDSWTDLWISSVSGLVIVCAVLYPSFILHNWSNNQPLLTGKLVRESTISEFLHFSIKKEPGLVGWSGKKSLIVLSISIIFWLFGIDSAIMAQTMIAFGSGIDFAYEIAFTISNILFLALFLILIWKSMGIDHASSLFKIDTAWLVVAWLILIVMSIDLVIESSVFALIEISGMEIEEESYWVDPESVNNAVIYSLAVVNIVILGPILEEVIFRGYVLDTCRGFLQEREAVIISSCIFGLIHYSYGPIGIVLISIGGGLYAWIRLRTNSLIPAIICHSIWNGIIVLVFGIP